MFSKNEAKEAAIQSIRNKVIDVIKNAIDEGELFTEIQFNSGESTLIAKNFADKWGFKTELEDEDTILYLNWAE